jgi:hypothetical protein
MPTKVYLAAGMCWQSFKEERRMYTLTSYEKSQIGQTAIIIGQITIRYNMPTAPYNIGLELYGSGLTADSVKLPIFGSPVIDGQHFRHIIPEAQNDTIAT